MGHGEAVPPLFRAPSLRWNGGFIRNAASGARAGDHRPEKQSEAGRESCHRRQEFRGAAGRDLCFPTLAGQPSADRPRWGTHFLAGARKTRSQLAVLSSQLSARSSQLSAWQWRGEVGAFPPFPRLFFEKPRKGWGTAEHFFRAGSIKTFRPVWRYTAP
jgi:hypothetical protein